MSVKAVLFSVGCILAWFVLLPVIVIGGGLTLFTYAIVAELFAFVTGKPSMALDTTVAREVARRMCGGYGVPSRSTPHQPAKQQPFGR